MNSEILARTSEFFRRCRAWMDNENYIPKKFDAKSWSDEFAGKLLRALEDEMIKQKFCFQSGRIYLPTQYHIQISREDGQEFSGLKKEILLQELNRFVERCFRMLSIAIIGNDFVRLYVSSELAAGEIKILHQWEESYAPKIHFNGTDDFSEKTIVNSWSCANAHENEECETVWRKSHKQLFCLEIRQNGIREHNLPVFQREITLGRGSPSAQVDIILKGDLEISRHHAILKYQPDETFSLAATGQNPIRVGSDFVFAGQTANLNWDEYFQIGSYSFQMRR